MARPISKNELFSDIIGKCYIKMMLDVRNQKRVCKSFELWLLAHNKRDTESMA